MRNVKPGHTKPIVCLDAGHYGKYNRSPVVPTYYESDMTWKLHVYLKDELEKHGVEVKLTRAEQSKDFSLSNRGKASRDCDLFLSIHSNASSSESTDYPVAIVQLNGSGDELGELLAECIEATISTKQAGRIYKRKGATGGEYYGVLRSAAAVGTTGIILEHSFHTNTRAAKWLSVDANLQRMAAAEAKVIADWFGIAAEDTEKVTNKLDFAKSFSKAMAGTYKVSSKDGILNLRAGADASKPLIEAMPTGTYVKCYGYYTGEWLYVISESGSAGFCHSGYLIRV